MSVYIKNMEMPTDCENCIFCDDDACLMHKPNEYRSWVEEYKNCPLIPVPDHGDLIDRDALPWESQALMYGGNDWGLEVTDIEAAPVIIPADKGEK